MIGIKDVAVFIPTGLKTVRKILSNFVDFLDNHIIRGRGKWYPVRAVLAIVLALLALAISAVVVLAWFALGLLIMPVLTYLGWNWSVSVTQLDVITFRTAIGLNIAAVVLLSLLRSIVVRIKN